MSMVMSSAPPIRHLVCLSARVSELVEQVAKIAEEKFQVDAEYVLRRLIEIDQMDVADIVEDDGSFKPLSEWPMVWRNFISSIDMAEFRDLQA